VFLFGKINSLVFGFCGMIDNWLFGLICNFFDLVHNSGGSFGGVAAVVADGLLVMVYVFDGGGLICILVLCCGFYGFKGSFGWVSLVGCLNVFGGASLFCFDGVFTCIVVDVALVMMILAGLYVCDLFSFIELLDWFGVFEDGVSGLCIVYMCDYGVYLIERVVIEVVECVVYVFEEGGVCVEEIDLLLFFD